MFFRQIVFYLAILLFVSVSRTSIDAHTIYLKNGNTIYTKKYWKENGLINCYQPDGIIGIPENQVKKIIEETPKDPPKKQSFVQSHTLDQSIRLSHFQKNESKKYLVRFVIDGDTIILSNQKRIRYLGINTPEVAHRDTPSEPFGQIAKNKNRQLVTNHYVFLEFDENKIDRYGRTLAYVFLEDGTFVNAKLLSMGLAYCLFKPPNLKYSDLLLKIQRDAMNEKIGIWSQLKRQSVRLIGNKKGYRFHLNSCKMGKKTHYKNKHTIYSFWDAFFLGYSPCGACLSSRDIFYDDNR